MGHDSDVYLIATFGGKWNCFCKSPCVVLDSLKDTLAHMQNHIRKGDEVPGYAIRRLEREISERDAAGSVKP